MPRVELKFFDFSDEIISNSWTFSDWTNHAKYSEFSRSVNTLSKNDGYSQTTYLYGFSPVWIRTCFLRSLRVVNDLPQVSQLNVLPVCRRLWAFNLQTNILYTN